MTYKKYIQRNGKLYGPYIYSSKRVDGKVVSEYHGNKSNNHKKFLFLACGVFLLVVLIYFLVFSNKEISGKVALGIDTSYEVGESLKGALTFSLREGEFLPASSKIIFENSGSIQEFVLSDILTESPSEGEYYIYGKEIQGEGMGYGIEGEKEVYPELEFVLQVYTNSEDTEEVVEDIPSEQANETPAEEVSEVIPTEDSSIEVLPEEVSEVIPTEDSSIEVLPEEVSEVIEESVSPEESVSSEVVTEPVEVNTEESSDALITGNSIKGSGGIFASLFGLTGMISMELQSEVSGVVSKDKPFVYELKEGETAELKAKSVTLNGEEIKESLLSLTIEDNKIIVTTDYLEIKEGYGKDYFGDNEERVSLDLSALNLFLEEGDLTVKLVYGEEEIVKLSTVLNAGKEISEEVIIEEEESELGEELNETIIESNSTLVEINQTSNESTNFLFKDVGDSLTSKDKDILVSEFGNISLETIKSELVNGRIILEYKIGEYSVEYSYDSYLDNETLNIQMEKDRIKFLKDIASSIYVEKDSAVDYENSEDIYIF